VALTKYVVLAGNDAGWKVVDQRDAHSAKAARTGYYKEQQDRDGLGQYEFVAVPARSWQPKKLEVEVKEQVHEIEGQLTFADAEG
jgi:hypothetical protein